MGRDLFLYMKDFLENSIEKILLPKKEVWIPMFNKKTTLL